MRYYIIAGEASGDLHGAALMNHISLKDNHAHFRVWGGDLMESAGGHLVKHYRDLAFMGFWEVLKNIRTILANLKFCKNDILNFDPDVLILVDYPGFNLRIAKWAETKGIKVFYFISPQVWAWNSKRVKGIKKSVDEMFVILPFEKPFYARYDYPVHYVGHPLLDVVNDFEANSAFKRKFDLTKKKKIIALLPGSRRQEIKRMLPVMLQMIPRFPEFEFVIAGAPGIPDEYYRLITAEHQVQIVKNQTYDLLSCAHAALVTSGTATLETALFNVPQVVCYQGNQWSYLLARRLVNVDYIALVNLIMDKPVVTELIQEAFTPHNLAEELKRIDSGKARQVMLDDYRILKDRLGNNGAAERTAGLMISILRKGE